MRLWRELEASQGVSLLELIGGPMLRTAREKVLSGSRGRVAGVEPHDITRNELAERWPSRRPRADDVGLFGPMAGVLDPEAGVIAASASPRSLAPLC